MLAFCLLQNFQKLVDQLQASPVPKSDDKTEEPAKKRQRKKKVKNMEKLDDEYGTSTSKEKSEDSEGIKIKNIL